METIIPEPTEPLGPEVTDMQVLEGPEEKPIYDTDEAHSILNLVKDLDRAEEFVRLSEVRKYRRNHHYWNGYQYLAWDELANDWKTPADIIAEDPQSDIDPSIYAKVVNVYKAHGEIFIGALTAGLPRVRFFPADADDADDVTAAKAKSRVAELIQRQNKAHLLLMKSLFLLYNEGSVACYNENKTDFRFGKTKVTDYQDVNVTNRTYSCPACGAPLDDPSLPAQVREGDPVPPPDQIPVTCPNCQSLVTPDFEEMDDVQQEVSGEHDEPKNRECLEIYGPLHVKFPHWCRDQFSTPYIILETEENAGLMRSIYPEFADKITSSSYPDVYDKEYRVPSAYKNDFPRDLVTVQRVWLRPWALNLIGDGLGEEAMALKAKYPEGVYAVILNHSLVVEILQDKLDDHWTIIEHPLAETLHPEPIGAPMVPIQDITNELTNLELETVEFGIPEVFADPGVLDFDSYKRNEARPGQVSEARAPAGQNLSSGFFEMKASTMSRELDSFQTRIEKFGQFVQGTYPSIFGGVQQGGGGTAREYELSRAAALQRLTTTWTVVQEWWVASLGKAVESYIKNMREDTQYVQGKGSGFINAWIRREEFTGETGEVSPEVSEAFPISWAQKRDAILSLLQMGNEDINTVIRHPENASMIASIIGVGELYIPGDVDRNKQLIEIAKLLREQPFPVMPSEMNPRGIVSSVPVQGDIDNHFIEAEICKAWLKSEVGLDSMQTNPDGRANVEAHFREHAFFLQVLEQEADEKEAEGEEEVSEEGLEPEPVA